MKSNKLKYLNLIIIFIISSCIASKKTVEKDWFSKNIESKTDCLNKHGKPDFIYKDEFKKECWAYYDSTKSINSICFYENNKMATSNWQLNFKMPDTTEIIRKTPEWQFLKFYAKSFQIDEPKEGEFQFFIIPSFYNESVIIFNQEDSIGNIQTANENIWRVIYSISQEKDGLDSLKLNDFKYSSGYKSKEINIVKLNELLVKYPIDTLGSIEKKGISILDGTSIHIKSNRNGKIFYSSIEVVLWYDFRFEEIKNEIINCYNTR